VSQKQENDVCVVWVFWLLFGCLFGCLFDVFVLGAQTRPEQCCNTCEEVREAYRIRGWAFANPEGIVQCNTEGFSKNLAEAAGEGCQIYGYLLVNKVAGNFHFSPGKSFQAGGGERKTLVVFGLLKSLLDQRMSTITLCFIRTFST
jgi:hypothetical protein